MLSEIPRVVQRAADQAALLYLHDPNVSLIDIGWRIRDRQDYAVEREICVRVHLRNKLRGDDFRSFAERHPERVIDANLIGYTVDLPGDARYYPHLVTGYSPVSLYRRVVSADPICGGISISNPLMEWAGTLGGWVIDRQTKQDMILSNWHVLCCPWAEWNNLPIYQPGRLDGGFDYYTVAYTARHAMDQNVDAAVAVLTGMRRLINNQREIGAVTGVTSPRLGMHVVKSGRTTGRTAGVIDGFAGRKMFNYFGFSRMLREYFRIIPTVENSQVSAPGDSGALWLEEGTGRAVGLHFGGNNDPEVALAFSMPEVLEALQVDLVI